MRVFGENDGDVLRGFGTVRVTVGPGSMAKLSPNQRKSLEALCSACARCACALHSAGEVVEKATLRSHYVAQSDAWRRSAQELNDLLENHDEADGPGSVVASLVRTWIKLKSAVGDVDAIVAECHRREAEARTHLAAAEDFDPPPLVRDALEKIVRRIGRLVPPA
jgi:uncharacterized protein (TIGR02284 family)